MREVKSMFKRNQIMITALAIMIAAAGYLNFAGTKIGEEELVSTGAEAGEELTALMDISEEDLFSDIYSMEPEDEALAVDYFLDEQMQILDNSMLSVESDSVEEAEVLDGETPGEAVYTGTAGISVLSGARLLKEQTRARNKETLLEIINNANISESQKQDAVNGMIRLTDIAEREAAAEILLETRGFANAVVTITGDSADVVVGMTVLSDAQCAQIEDIVIRKTGVAAQNIVINPMTGQ